MTFLSALFLILQLLILAIGVIVGYRRGVGRSAVRLAYLAIIGIVAFFLGRFTAAQLSDAVMQSVHGMLPSDIKNLLGFAPEFETLAGNIIGAFLTPLLFAALFGILQLASLIFFKTLSGKLVSAIYQKENAPSFSKWAGAAIGLAASLVTSAALLVPLYIILDVVDNTPNKAITIFAEAYSENGIPDFAAAPSTTSTLKANPTTLDLNIKPSFNTAKVSPWNAPLANLLTSYAVHEGGGKATHESLTHSLPLIVEMAGDALYAYNCTANSGGGANDALTNTGACAIPYLDRSATVKYVSANIICALGKTFQCGNDFFGLSLPESDDPIVKSMIDNLVDVLANTTADTVKNNMITLFGLPTIAYDLGAPQQISVNQGLLATMMKLNADDALSSLAESNSVFALVSLLAENDNMSAMLDDIRKYATDMIEEKGVDLSEQKYESFYDDVKQEITTQITAYSQEETASVTDMAKSIESTLGGYLEEHNIPADEMQISVVAVCIAKEFSSEQYMENGEFSVSTKDVMTFFGIDEADIPAWAH